MISDLNNHGEHMTNDAEESQKKAVCMQCSREVEELRQSYAHPLCFACLPPPPPLEPLRPGDTPSPGHVVAAMSGGAPLPEAVSVSLRSDGAALVGAMRNDGAETVAPRVVVPFRAERTRTDGTYPDAPPDPVAAVVARTIVERAVEGTRGPIELPPLPAILAGGAPRRPAPRSPQFLFIEGGKHPPIVTLCGSTRFRRAFEAATFRLTLEGWAVLSVACFSRGAEPGDEARDGLTPNQKDDLDRLHLSKIAMSNAIHVLNPGGYIGASTAREIGFAFALGLPITFLDEAEGDRWLTANAHAIGPTMAKHLGAEREAKPR